MTLVIAEALWPVQENLQPGIRTEIRLPSLKKLIARSRYETLTETSYDRRLFELFNLLPPDQDDLPLAALTIGKHDKSMQQECYYIFADPVHLQADRDSIFMMGNQNLVISNEESNRLIHDINTHFGDEPFTIEPLTARHWYLSMPRSQEIRTTPMHEVINRDIQSYLPHGGDSRYWRKILNEIQMLLSANEVNREREASGDPPINSLWLWGGGKLPVATQTSWTTVCGDDDLLQALAVNAGISCESCLADASSWYDLAGAGEHLVKLDSAWISHQDRDVEAWKRAMIELEANWFSPLLKMAQATRLTNLKLYLDTSSCYHLTPALARHWWKDMTNRNYLIKYI